MAPENFEPAHVGSRILGGLLDFILVAIPIQILSAALNKFLRLEINYSMPFEAIFGIYILGFLGYYTLSEALYGETLGKHIIGIKVVSNDGSDIGPRTSIVRNSLRVLDYLPIAYIAGILTITFTEENQRIGDLVAGTQVVMDD